MRYSKSDNLKAITADVKSAICILGLEFIHSNPRMQIAKNTYGGRFAVYRIADCVPMREKRPLTSKGVSLEIGNFCTLSALFNQLSYAASSYRL